MRIISKFTAIFFCLALFLLWNSCSNSSGDGSSESATPSGGGTQTPTTTETPTTTTPTTYKITISDGIENGTITADKQTAAEGETVTLTISPSGYYVLNTLNYTPQDESAEYLCGIGDTRTFVMPAKNVTICADFEIPRRIAFTGTAYSVTGSVTIGETQYDLVVFGDWPQSRIKKNIIVGETTTAKMGSFTYYKGNDGSWYVKKEISEGNLDYFKVEPIKWRVVAKESNWVYVGNAQSYVYRNFLVAENALVCKRFDDDKKNYADSEIRSWLNNEFLNTAFTSSLQICIAEDTVDNTEWTAYPYGMTTAQKKRFFGGDFSYSGGHLTDKIFLLSEQNVTYDKYGFSVYTDKSEGNTRIRKPVDFAILDYGDGGVNWWLLTACTYNSCERYVRGDGYANCYGTVTDSSFGVVPALRVDCSKLN
ncbi:MAG: hypothetical protein IK015_01680 [Treponema sp.]|nr:hypothetical protein [Treponema sp.]